MLYSINAVANQLGITRKTLRLWEKEGKINKVGRLSTGHRYYTEEDINVIKEKMVVRK